MQAQRRQAIYPRVPSQYVARPELTQRLWSPALLQSFLHTAHLPFPCRAPCTCWLPCLPHFHPSVSQTPTLSSPAELLIQAPPGFPPLSLHLSRKSFLNTTLTLLWLTSTHNTNPVTFEALDARVLPTSNPTLPKLQLRLPPVQCLPWLLWAFAHGVSWGTLPGTSSSPPRRPLFQEAFQGRLELGRPCRPGSPGQRRVQ